MFSSLLFPGLGRLAGAVPQIESDVCRPMSAPGAASLMALHEAEVTNRSPILRPSTTAENKSTLTTSDSTTSNTDLKHVKSPLMNSTTTPDENLAPANSEVGNSSTDEVFHTPLVAAGSDISLKFKEAKIVVSTSTQAIFDDSPSPPKEGIRNTIGSLHIRRGKIEPLGISVPATYADATNVRN
ncbi:uncharacterized protein PHACADRAFT_113785, partial [Phanerochaete carnosa HHB-10118-sp]